MFEDRTYKRTFYSAPQSVTSFVAALLEPSITVACFLAISALYDEPILRSSLTLCLLVFALTFPGRNRFRDSGLTNPYDRKRAPNLDKLAHSFVADNHHRKAAAKEAYRSAGITAKDIHMAETHDCFTISEIMEYEDLGFCKKGEGGRFVEDGQSDLGGKVPINTRGGLIGCGHPLGATGIGQAIEIFWQFNSLVPKKRQVAKVDKALAHNLSGLANVHSILVYGRDAK
jgi:hypothetical protein